MHMFKINIVQCVYTKYYLQTVYILNTVPSTFTESARQYIAANVTSTQLPPFSEEEDYLIVCPLFVIAHCL